MSIRDLSPALLKKAKDELGEVPSRIPDDIKAIKDWLAKQPYINANLDERWILTFLRGCKFSLERTKEKIDYFYTAKSLAPDMTSPLDLTDEKYLKFYRLGGCVPLKKPITEDGVVVLIFRPGVYNPDEYSIFESTRLQYMFYEMLMMECDNFVVSGVRLLADLKNISMGHLIQVFTPTVAKKMAMCGEKALPVRQKGAHHMNTPPGIETLFNLIRPLVSEKLNNRIFIHNQDYDELYKYIPRECLPVEFGGDTGTIQELVEYWEPLILSYKDYFNESKIYKTDESKRPGKPYTVEDLYGVDGSFRSLNVD